MNTNIVYLALMVLFLSILEYFEKRDSKKPRGALCKLGPISKKNWISHFFLAKGKNLTPRQVEIPKWPKKGQL